MAIKTVLFKYTMDGNGIVNYDTNRQKYIFFGECVYGDKSDKEDKSSPKKFKIGRLMQEKIIYNNYTYAKKKFSRDEDGNLDYKIRISKESMSAKIWKDDMIRYDTTVQSDIIRRNRHIGSLIGFLKGFNFSNIYYTNKLGVDVTKIKKKENRSVKLARRSPIVISSAVQTSSAISKFEVGTRSGGINETVDDGSSGTSLYYKERIGDISYGGSGYLDLSQMQFLSCDENLDRMAFFETEFENHLKHNLCENFPDNNFEIDEYHMNDGIKERGIKITDDNVLFQVKETLKRIMEIGFLRSGSYAELSSLKIKLVEDVLVDTISNKANWIDIHNFGDIDNLNFEVEQFYNKF